MLISMSACEPIAPIEIHNKTSETLMISINEAFTEEVQAGDRIKNKIVFIEARFLIEAKNLGGKTIYRNEIKYEDMKEMDWEVIIQPLDENPEISDNVTITTTNIPDK